MTSVQTMLARLRRLGTRGGAVLGFAVVLGACAGGGGEARLEAPLITVAPYDAAAGERLWAVIPPRNESGVSLVDPLWIGDRLVGAVEEVQGVRCLPINRTLEAMRELNMAEATSPDEVRRLAQALGVDGVIIGTVSAFDPYDPPVLGLTLALYLRSGEPGGGGIDPRALSSQPREIVLPGTRHAGAPSSVVSAHLDARSHDVLACVQDYARGRDDPRRALGWRRYLASMDLYTQFSAFHAVRRLLEEEGRRLASAAPETGD